ncbi:MAG TPA: hypothetical protein VFX13_15615, partial [Gaiellales bacterium]|nr:hypothetical protein [Gaiellales bacterium]
MADTDHRALLHHATGLDREDGREFSAGWGGIRRRLHVSFAESGRFFNTSSPTCDIGTVTLVGVMDAPLPTLYKARNLPLKRPVCAICIERTKGRTEEVRLGYRVTVWLCPGHASRAFQTKRS